MTPQAILHRDLSPDSVLTGQQPVATVRHARIPALDFTKGALVLIMVLYHWLNYFISTEGFFYRYLRFLTPSFIFISGFLIAQVYFGTYGVTNPKVPRRLLERGLKILAVFVFLNLIRGFLIPDSRSGIMSSAPLALSNIMRVYVTGNVTGADGKAAAFFILVPISYLLLVSAGLVILCRFYKYAIHILCVVLLLCILLLGLKGLEYGNLELVTVGLLGMAIGYIPITSINSLASRRIALVIAYLCYIGVISVWTMNYPIQLFAVCVNLIVIYALGTSQGAKGKGGKHVMLLGSYSLFGYIVQIAILQLLYRSLRLVDLGVGRLALVFLAAFALTMGSVELLDRARRRVALVDRAYKFVFA